MEDKRNRLIGLGAASLADMLLDAADWHEDVMDRVDRAIASPKENVRRFRAKLQALKRRKGFIDWNRSTGFARGLRALLEDLWSGVDDPIAGLELVAAFYEADYVVFNQCDDSNGAIGDVFRDDASALFAHYASRCDDKAQLCDLVVKLNRNDSFGVRDSVIERAAEYLPDTDMRQLVERFWELAHEEENEDGGRHWIFKIESLARQLRDAALFEKARRAAWPDLSAAACVDIAQVHFESGDARTALSWLERIPQGETFQAHERDRLLLMIHEQLGQGEKLAEVAWRRFNSHYSVDSLNILLSAIGEAKREQVIDGATRAIRQDNGVSSSAASFLIDVGRMDDAEAYLLERSGELNGDFYSSLLPLAQAMEDDGRMLAATVVCRALLDSILRRGQSRYYHHGVRYLKRLDAFSRSIQDWGDVPTHASYVEGLKEIHGKKRSFWSRYGKSDGLQER